MIIHQHLFGKTRGKDFSTLAASLELSKNDLVMLERHSHYKVPLKMLYDSDFVKPVKYVYYPLNKEKFVIGRGFYKGKDEIGRVGNYIFHNLLLSREELERNYFNPIQFIKKFEAEEIFITETEGIGKLQPLQLVEEVVADNSLYDAFNFLSTKQKELIPPILNECFKPYGHKPLQIIGSHYALIFLWLLFDIMPVYLRFKISFDTLHVDKNLSYYICGFPSHEEAVGFPLYSLRINAESGDIMPDLQSNDNDLYYYSIHLFDIWQKADEGRLSSLRLADENAVKNDWSRFGKSISKLSLQDQAIIFKVHRQAILNEIKEGSYELFKDIEVQLTLSDLDYIFRSIKFLKSLVLLRDEQTVKKYTVWFCHNCSADVQKELFLIVLEKNILFQELIKLLKKEPSSELDANIVQRMIESFYTNYKLISNNEQKEKDILDLALEFIISGFNVNIGLPFVRNFSILPNSKNNQIQIMRAILAYINGYHHHLLRLLKSKHCEKTVIRLLANGAINMREDEF
jgi:hypothetical protein